MIWLKIITLNIKLLVLRNLRVLNYNFLYFEIILDKIVKKWVPHTYSAFKEFQLESYNLSKTAIEVIKKKLQGKKISYEKSGLSKREWAELTNKFGFKK